MKFHFFLALAIFSITASAQNFVKVNSAPINEVGDPSWASAWGDYDNDGYMDLYVSNYFEKNFLYHNNGNKTFTKITTGSLVTSESIGHWSSTWVDYDDDGDLDMYVVNSYTDLNELLRNNGNGTFTSISSAITNTSATDDNNAAWADTDNDGDLDLFLANGSNSTPATQNQNNSFFINNGNGTFTQNTTSVITTDGGFSQHATFGDYDNDNDQDLIVVNNFGDNFFYENKGSNLFERVLGLPFLSTGTQPLTAVWGDFNNDTFLDLVIGSYDLSRVYYNNGNKTFHIGTFPGIAGNATGVTTGDFNLDGNLDVIFIRTSQTSLLYINNGNETFTNSAAGELTLTTLDYTNSGAVADYDNDGDLDVFINNDNSGNLLFENTEVTGNWVAFKLVGTNSNSQGIGAKVRVRTNGQWQTREVSVLSSYRTQNSVLAHFGLGSAKFIDSLKITWPSGKVQKIGRFHKINTNFTIREDVDFYDFKDVPASVLVTDNLNTRSNSWVDYDKDGDLDVLTGTVSSTSTNGINLYQNQGNNTFINTVGTSITGFAGSVYSSTWGDYDHDGDADLFATNNDLDKANVLYQNNGDGTLAKLTTGPLLSEITYSQGSSWADYDNDNKLDMFVSNWHYLYPDRSNSLYKGDGAGGFTLVSNSVFASDLQVASFRTGWSDIDDDGDADLVVTTVVLDKTLLYRNNGNGTFTRDLEWFNNAQNTYSLGVSFADYDNDGDPDLYLSSGDRLYNNDGTGKFTRVTGLAFDGEASEAGIWGDYDNDGDLDLYLANGGGPEINSLYRNEGDGTFAKINSFGTQDASNSRSAAWVDINNDQYLDLFVGNIGLNKMFVNQGGIFHALQVNLDGVQSNGSGIGAKVKIRTGNKWQVREVFSQQSSNLRAHFGLGEYTQADVVRIEWPSGNTTVLKNVAADQILSITEVNTVANDLHTMAPVELEGDEDGEITFDKADFMAAFHDDEGDKLKKIKLTAVPEDGVLFYDGVEVAGTPEIPVADIGKLSFKPYPEFNGETSFEYAVTDNRALSTTATIHATIEAVNDAPTIELISDIDAQVLAEGEVVEIFFSVFDIDNDAIDLEISVDPDDTDFTPPGNFELEVIDDNLRLYKFHAVRGGSAMVTVKVSDGELEASTSFTLTINMAHSLDVAFSTGEDQDISFTAADFTDNFVDGEGDVLSEIRVTALPEHGVLYLNMEAVRSNDVLAVEDLDGLTYTPAIDFNGVDDFSYDAVDTREFRVNFTSEITVTPVNDEPKITSLISIDQEARPGENAEVEIHFADVDTPLEQLTISAVADNTTVAPAQDTELTGTGYQRIFRLKAKEPGSAVITVTVSDGALFTTTEFVVVVIPNTPLSLSVDFEVNEDATYQFKPGDFITNVEDAEGDDLVKIKVTKVPAHGTLMLGSVTVVNGTEIIAVALGNLKYTPMQDFDDEDTFEYDILDEFDLATACVSTITIKPLNDAPVLSGVADKTIDRLFNGDVTTVDVQLTDVDNEDADLTLTASSDNRGVLSSVSITGTTTTRAINMKVAKGGTTTITLIATDGDVVLIKTFNLTVMSVVTGLEDSLGDLLTVYPNPLTDKMNIDVGSIGGDISFEIVDGIGRVLKQGRVTKEGVDVQDMSAGIYMVKCMIGERVWMKKIVKR